MVHTGSVGRESAVPRENPHGGTWVAHKPELLPAMRHQHLWVPRYHVDPHLAITRMDVVGVQGLSNFQKWPQKLLQINIQEKGKRRKNQEVCASFKQKATRLCPLMGLCRLKAAFPTLPQLESPSWHHHLHHDLKTFSCSKITLAGIEQRCSYVVHAVPPRRSVQGLWRCRPPSGLPQTLGYRRGHPDASQAL